MEKFRRRESQSSLPDQLAIESTTESSLNEVNFPALGKPNKLLRRRQTKQLQAILKPHIPTTKRYFTKGSKVTESNRRCIVKEISPFHYPTDMEEFAQKLMTKAWRVDVRLKELQKKYDQRSNYRTRQQKDLLNRLYVEDPKPTTMQTVHELDPNYFDITEGTVSFCTNSIHIIFQNN